MITSIIFLHDTGIVIALFIDISKTVCVSAPPAVLLLLGRSRSRSFRDLGYGHFLMRLLLIFFSGSEGTWPHDLDISSIGCRLFLFLQVILLIILMPL